MNAFEKALKFTLQYEGGYVNDPDDHGGATNYGITQGTYNAWRKKQGQPVRSVKQIESIEVSTIYKDNYWKASHAHELPEKLAVAVFDWAVNSGVSRAIKKMQQMVGILDDGIYGPVTRQTIQETLRTNLELPTVKTYLNLREKFFRSIATGNQKKFLRGWLNRLNALRKYVGVA